jgi:hypothetical protein
MTAGTQWRARPKSRRSRGARAWALLVLLALAAPNPALSLEAYAQTSSPVERAREYFKEGAAAYAAGDYPHAIEALGNAYELTPLPAIAFSLAQAERKQYLATKQAQHLERSVELFRRYLEQEPNGGRRADARDALTQLLQLAGPALTTEPSATGDTPGSGNAQSPTSGRTETPTRVMITSEAEGARVALDGAELTPAPLIREVTPGQHEVHVVAPGYYPQTRKLTAFKGELMLKDVVLQERPSVLLLSTPDECDVYIDGSYVSPGGPATQIQVSSGSHKLTVTKNGYHARSLDVQTRRGATTQLKVRLEQTTQRTTALGLFIGGGALLGGSVVLNAFRIRAENRAETFLRIQSTRNVTSDELLRYRATTAERDALGGASAVALAGAAGLFISGLFLHELDQPDLERLPGADTWPRERTPVQLGFGAWSTGDASGGSFYGQF